MRREEREGTGMMSGVRKDAVREYKGGLYEGVGSAGEVRRVKLL